jgi:hypothetical protein
MGDRAGQQPHKQKKAIFSPSFLIRAGCKMYIPEHKQCMQIQERKNYCTTDFGLAAAAAAPLYT